MSRHREEVLNTELAACIVARGMSADPETILKGGTARPDVLVKFLGLRCAIEGKVGDVSQAESIAAADAKRRIEQGIAHLAVAVVYPAEMRTTDYVDLSAQLSTARFNFAVFTDGAGGEWRQGGIDEMLGELRRAHDVIVKDDVLAQAVATLNAGLEDVATALMDSAGTCDRLIGLLGVGARVDATATV